MSTDPMSSEIITVQSHIIEKQKKHPEATGQFSWLLSGITLATKIIESKVRRAGLLDILGSEGRINVQGEIVQKLEIGGSAFLGDEVGTGQELTGRIINRAD